MHFEFATAGRIVFGPGVVSEVGPAAAHMGRRALLLTGRTPRRAACVSEALREHDVVITTAVVSDEPTTDLVRDLVDCARAKTCDLVVSVGGGSVLDAGKAVAALLTNGGVPLDYLEVIGRGQRLLRPAAPHIAVPTTAGTGTEVTANAVLKSPEHRVKVSLRGPTILPSLALVDPELTHSLPPSVTASTGLDAFTQLIEPYVSHQANPITDGLCREGIQRVARSLRRAFESGDDCGAREDMALASLFGGLGLANAKLGAVHGFAGVLGGMFPAPHGAICGRLLPCVMAANVRALTGRASDGEALRRYDEIARWLTGSVDAVAADGLAWVAELCQALATPPLSQYGMTEESFPAVINLTLRSSSMKGNPISLTEDELRWILEQSL
ncbi:MAG: iron-containing alcohol dehydrogenase [Chloroflexi bacterium]|nr:iron-containing alcohol dehydrogenase [Chloroflexota bacterium]